MVSDEIPKPLRSADNRARSSGRPSPARGPAGGDEAASADRLAAREMRKRLAREPAVEISPDRAVAGLLLPGERLFAIRRRAVLDRRETPGGRVAGLVGHLYLTSTRLLFVGRACVASYHFADLAEVSLNAEGLLLVVRDGTGVRLGVDRPQLLRVEVAAAWRGTAD